MKTSIQVNTSTFMEVLLKKIELLKGIQHPAIKMICCFTDEEIEKVQEYFDDCELYDIVIECIMNKDWICEIAGTTLKEVMERPF